MIITNRLCTNRIKFSGLPASDMSCRRMYCGYVRINAERSHQELLYFRQPPFPWCASYKSVAYARKAMFWKNGLAISGLTVLSRSFLQVLAEKKGRRNSGLMSWRMTCAPIVSLQRIQKILRNGQKQIGKWITYFKAVASNGSGT